MKSIFTVLGLLLFSFFIKIYYDRFEKSSMASTKTLVNRFIFKVFSCS